MKNTIPIQLNRWLLILIIPLILIIGSVTVLTSPAYLSFEYAKSSFPADPMGFTPEERLSHAADNLRYIRQGLPATFLEQQDHNGQPLYNLREISHMADVQAVFRATWNGAKILLVLMLFLITAMTWREEHRTLFFLTVQQAGVITAILITAVGLLAVLSWNAWFSTFHQLFFQPGTWTFQATDTLIRLFPLPFWFDGALTASALTLSAGLLLAVLGGVFKKRVQTPVGI